MKKLIGCVVIIVIFLGSISFAAIEVDSDHPYHFQQDDDHFFLISKTAFPLLCDNYTDEQKDAFIQDAAASGFNSLRIWLLWREDGVYGSNPWASQPTDANFWQSFDTNPSGRITHPASAQPVRSSQREV